MNGVLPVSVGYAAIGGSVVAGAVWSVRARLGERARSLVQHAAVGTVLAGWVIDVLAKLIHRPGQLAWTAWAEGDLPRRLRCNGPRPGG